MISADKKSQLIKYNPKYIDTGYVVFGKNKYKDEDKIIVVNAERYNIEYL